MVSNTSDFMAKEKKAIAFQLGSLKHFSRFTLAALYGEFQQHSGFIIGRLVYKKHEPPLSVVYLC